MEALVSDESADVLRGTTVAVYRYMLKTKRIVGVREIQRALNLSSSSVAKYHLSKLEDAGLLKHERGNYVINKVLLEHSIRISHFLVPRYLFYAIFVITALIIELAVFRPPVFTQTYFLATITMAGCAVAFCYEAFKTWKRGGL